ncbi:MAG: bifunctional oligoribonuclease/PAP phosphatase NrnA [Firmicutes bacterium]|nr:bifunctional oligoribonuclease/PAP phosphatase NrnA [Bacillota bacterium]MCL2256363.1 bifunctional oligoribonuclease/PAP phosphatase NrnA [Bacillota bacterium]
MKKNNITPSEIVELIKVTDGNILIITHMRADGDCLGSGFALKKYCEKIGKIADIVTEEPAPLRYVFMPDYHELNNRKCDDYSLVICVDSADERRLGACFKHLKNAKTSLNIDHHKSNTYYGDFNYVIGDASSNCEIIFDILNEYGEMDKEIAYYLFIGQSSDTGHFQHRSTTVKTLEVATELLKHGIDLNSIIVALYKSNTMGQMKLIERAISSMKFYDDNKICIIAITKKDIGECGCVYSDTEQLVDYGMKIGDVQVAVLFSEHDKNSFKVSFRSKSVDVSEAASTFGGGGHKLASGCIAHGHAEDVRDKILKSVRDLF